MFSLKRITLLLVYVSSVNALLALSELVSFVNLLAFSLVFFVGALLDLRYGHHPPRLPLNLVALVLTLFHLAQISPEEIVEPLANTLLLLIGIKLLEEKRVRDLYQILLLSLIAIAAATTFKISLAFLAFFLLELFLGTLSLMFINLYQELGDVRVGRDILINYVKAGGLFLVSVATMSVLFFVILPRVQVPVFEVFSKRPALKSGIADKVEIGKVGEIQEDNTVVFRVYGLKDVGDDTYWRVSVFDRMEGTKWITSRKNPSRGEEETPSGKLKRYTVILEPSLGKYIPLMDYPVSILNVKGLKRESIYKMKGNVWRSKKVPVKPVKYSALSSDVSPADPPSTEYLEIPEGVPDSIRKLAKKLSKNKDPLQRIESVERFFKEGGFKYTTKLDNYVGHPLEYFLFTSKRGNCEFYASSTALLLRLMGIPSRVIGGFRGALKNEYGDYFIVTNSMAHVWVEAFVGGKWLRIDTTPSYTAPALSRISKIDLIRDYIVSFWYANVIGFSTEKQVSIVRSLRRGLETLSLKKFREMFKENGLMLASVLTLVLFLILFKELRRSPENLYRSLLRKLEKKKGVRLRNLMPEEILSMFSQEENFKNILFIVRLYQKQRFSREKVSRKELSEGYRALRNI